MTKGRMSPAMILALIAVLGFCLGVMANEKPIYITKQASPDAPEPTPDPNWELKEQMGIVPNPGQTVPDFDPNGRVGPRKGPAPVKQLPATGYLAEDFETSVPPPGWGLTSTHTDTMTWYQNDYNPYSGSYYADCKYDPDLIPQDEWLYTPVMDFESATADLKVTFYWMMSYYWGVDPFDNYNLELWISTDAGASYPTKLWDEHAFGIFTSWTWYETQISLAAYVGEKDVVLAWRYVGTDGAQASLDLVSVDDNPPPLGRCCYGDPAAPSCDDIDQLACEALADFISWDGDLNCTDNPCPMAGPGDNCASPLTITMPADLPYTDANQFTCGRGDDYGSADMCYTYGYGGGEDIVYEITVTETIDVILTMDPKGTTWTYCEIRTECIPPNGECVMYFRSTGGAPYSSGIVTLAAGTYYMIIDTWPSPDCIPDFDITIEQFTGGNQGDDCTNPLLIKLPDDLPYTTTDGTCGRADFYDATCLGSYDNGEDILYQLDVDAPVSLDITLDPKGTTYTGIVVDDNCPPDNDCIATSTSGYSSNPHGFVALDLEPGTYYIMIDTWPSPDCIPEFDLIIVESAGGPENDDCADAIAVGEVVDLAFSTVGASFDGGGTCMSSPNIWYCYTATCDGAAAISLCGSGYDTKIAVYDGCTCAPLPAELACNDDACGLQSEVRIPVTAGNQYLIEVGGYGSNTGSGILNITCFEPPPNDNCSDVTPVTLTIGTPTTFTGNNEGATGDCATLDPGATEAWEAFTLTETADVTIDYCGTTPSFELVYIVLADQCPCGDLTFAQETDWSLCGGDGNITMYYPGLPAGTYYIPVLSYHPDYASGYYYAGDYVINVLATEWEPAYCDASGGCDEYIERVQLAEIDNSSACEGYGDFTDQIAILQLGVGYPITITIGNSYSSDYGGVWIDWNQDWDFTDPGEQIALDVYNGNGPYTGTITVPDGAAAGQTRMRVRLSYASAPGPCGTTSYGEAEDYTVNVGGEQSDLTIDPQSIDFGMVQPGAMGSTTMTLGAVGEVPISFSIQVSYGEKASVGGGQAEPTLKANPFQSEGLTPAADKSPNQLLFEGFESGTVPPPGWTATIFNPAGSTWTVGSYSPYEGSYYATIYYDASYSGNQNEWLISPALDFGGSKYLLDFWWFASYYWSVDPYDNCDLSVWISIDGGNSWLMELWNEDQYGVFTTWEWNNTVLDLSVFKDESNVKIAFVYTGYDGAQMAVDAISINPAPLTWLSADPASGQIPGNGTVPIEVIYNAADLDEGTYTADLVITHSGAAKAVATVPVSMLVSTQAPTDIVPYPMVWRYAYTMDPLYGTMYVRNDSLPGGYTVADVDQGSLVINDDILPESSAIVADVLNVVFACKPFIKDYEPMWDTLIITYTIGGSFTDTTPFTLNYEVPCIGFKSGDANLDDQVNIGDAVFILSYVFRNGEAPQVEETADANCDYAVNIADAVRLINFIFRKGTLPCHP